MYEELERAVVRGTMEVTGTRPKRYFSVSPEQLLRREEEKQATHAQTISSLTELIPILRQYAVGEAKKTPEITTYQGVERIRRAYARELELTKGLEVASIVGSLLANYKLLPEQYWQKWNQTFAAQGSSCRMLVHASALADDAKRQDRYFRRETRTLTSFEAALNIDIFANHVLLVSCEDKTALWLESASIAASYRILFEALWRTAK
jgi:hypothetical protein